MPRPRCLTGLLFLLVALVLDAPPSGAAPSPILDSEPGGPAHPANAPSSDLRQDHWLNPAWPYRLKITVDPDSVEGTAALIDFPFLLSLDGSTAQGVFVNAKPDGSDLVVTKHDGVTPLSREIVSYDDIGQSAEIWFAADTLSKTVHEYFLYYGNPDTSIVHVHGAVWQPAFLGVYHFAEDPGQGVLLDYSGHAAHGLPQGGWTSSDLIAGAVGQGWHFNGTSHWIDGDAMALASTDSSFTIGAWFAVWDLLDNGADFAFGVGEGYWHLSAKRNGQQRHADLANANGSIAWYPSPLPNSSLHNFTWLLDAVSDTARFFFDGREQNVRFRYAPNPPHKVYTGNRIAGNVGIAGPIFGSTQDLMVGIVDEFRVYEGIRTREWIRTEYRNQKHSDGFYLLEDMVFSDVLAFDPGSYDVHLIHATPNPFRNHAAIRLDLPVPATGQLIVFDVAGRPVRTLSLSRALDGVSRTTWDGRRDDGRDLGTGIYLLRAKTSAAEFEGRIVLIR